MATAKDLSYQFTKDYMNFLFTVVRLETRRPRVEPELLKSAVREDWQRYCDIEDKIIAAIQIALRQDPDINLEDDYYG